MQITIQGHNLDLTQALKNYAAKKFDKIHEFFKNIQKIEVILDYRTNDDLKRSHVAEASIWLAGKKVIRASEAGENMYAAIDLVVDELKRQVIKHKEKHNKENRRKAEKLKEISRNAQPVEFTLDVKKNSNLVKLKRFDIKTMTKKEAQAEQKVLGQNFFIFLDADTSELNILDKSKPIAKSKIKTYSEDQAYLEITKKGIDFLPYINPETDELNVIYKRKSGNFGLIEPIL